MTSLTAINTADGKPLNGQTVTAGPLKMAFVGDAPGTKVVIDCWIGAWHAQWWSDQPSPALPAGNATIKARYQGNPYPPTFQADFKVVAVNTPATGTLTIHAFNDTDADGVQDKGEGNKLGAAFLIQPGNITGTTDANGNKTVDLPAGTYTLTRTNTPAGYRMSNPTTPGGSSITFTAAAGQNRTVLLGTTDKPAATPDKPSVPVIGQTAGNTADGDVKAGDAFFFGVDVYDGNSALPTSGLLKPLGIQGNRVWIGAAPFNTYRTPGELAHAIDCWRQTGARPLFMVGGEPVHTADLAKAPGWFVAFAGDAIAKIDAIPALKGQSLEIEVFNETDLAQYFDGNAGQYAAALLAIAKALKAAYGNRVRICTAGLSWRSSDLHTILPVVKGYVDAIGYHGYPPSVSDARAKDDAILAIGKQYGLPVWYTEFGQGRGKDAKAVPPRITPQQWAAESAGRLSYVVTASRTLGVPVRVYWYAAINVNNSTNAGQSLASIASGKLATTVFYDLALAALKQTGAR